MIGYDLDGVIAPDIEWMRSEEIFRECQSSVCPLFIPPRPFCIITARCPEDEDKTMRWLDKYDIRPKYVKFGRYSNPISNIPEKKDIHSFGLNSAINHKIESLEEDPNIHMFLESNPKQAEAIKNGVKRSNVIVYHYASWLQAMLRSESRWQTVFQGESTCHS
jgi:hypothetical protein